MANTAQPVILFGILINVIVIIFFIIWFSAYHHSFDKHRHTKSPSDIAGETFQVMWIVGIILGAITTIIGLRMLHTQHLEAEPAAVPKSNSNQN